MKKIGIVTLYKNNYGSLLQSYALSRILRCFGYEPVVIGCREHKAVRLIKLIKKTALFLLTCLRYPEKWRNYSSFLKQKKKSGLTLESQKKLAEFEQSYLNVSCRTYREWKQCAGKEEYAYFISGSDQIWGVMGMRPNPFDFLQFAPIKKRAAYAPSFGVDQLPVYEKALFRRLLKDIPHLSVREKSGQTILLELLGIQAPVLLDPVLLLTREEWGDVMGKNQGKLMGTSAAVVFFIDEPSRESLEEIKEICRKAGCEVHGCGYDYPALQQIERYHFREAAPLEFLSELWNAKLILTDSFHATVFAISFNVPFFTYERQYGHRFVQPDRIRSLLELVGMPDRYLEKGRKAGQGRITFQDANRILEQERRSSLAYLAGFLNQDGHKSTEK